MKGDTLNKVLKLCTLLQMLNAVKITFMQKEIFSLAAVYYDHFCLKWAASGHFTLRISTGAIDAVNVLSDQSQVRVRDTSLRMRINLRESRLSTGSIGRYYVGSALYPIAGISPSHVFESTIHCLIVTNLEQSL